MTDIYILLLKYISGEATPEEAASVVTWINSSAENKKEFEQYWKIMELTSKKGNYQIPDVANEWNKIQNAVPSSSIIPKYKNFLLGGAVSIVVAVVLFFVFNPFKDKKTAIVVRSSESKVLVDTLLKDAILYLDTQSSITYPAILKQESTVKINGGVYIEDKKNSLSTIKITAGEIDIISEKATFYVSYDSALGTSEVHVQSGTVIVKHGEQQTRLQTGEAIKFDRTKNGTISKISFNINLFSYVTKIFDFRDTPLKEVIPVLEKGYGIIIKLNDSDMGNCRITALFDNKTLRQVLDIMAFTLNFEYEYAETSSKVLLSGKGCN